MIIQFYLISTRITTYQNKKYLNHSPINWDIMDNNPDNVHPWSFLIGWLPLA